MQDAFLNQDEDQPGEGEENEIEDSAS